MCVTAANVRLFRCQWGNHDGHGSLQWRHDGRDGVSNPQPHHCLLNRLFRRRSLAFVRGIHRWPVNSPHKGPVTRKMFSFDDVIMRNRSVPNENKTRTLRIFLGMYSVHNHPYRFVWLDYSSNHWWFIYRKCFLTLDFKVIIPSYRDYFSTSD